MSRASSLAPEPAGGVEGLLLALRRETEGEEAPVVVAEGVLGALRWASGLAAVAGAGATGNFAGAAACVDLRGAAAAAPATGVCAGWGRGCPGVSLSM